MKKVENLSEILPLFSPGSVVVLHSALAEPAGLGAQLAEHSEALRGVRVYNLMPMGEAPYVSPQAAKDLLVTTFFPSNSIRKAINDGRAKLWPARLSTIPGLFDSGEIRADFLCLQLSPPDEHGNMSLGISVDYMRSVIAQNPTIIAEINPKMPHTFGDTMVSSDQVEYAIDAKEPPQPIYPAGFDEVDDRIAANIAGLLNDGVVLQFGIGSIPDLTLTKIGHLRDIGIHSGFITEALIPLIEAGVVTNATKREFNGKVVTTMAGGTQKFYDFLDKNSDVLFQPTSYTHNFDVLAGIDRLFAINSVLQIDLLGRANAEKIGDRIISAAGGLPDFARGATASSGGASIIALRSTTRSGKASCIVSRLPSGAPVTVDSDHIDYVVTEFGTAHLRGLSINERAEALIAIAHPDSRKALAS